MFADRLKRWWIYFPHRGPTAYEWQLGRLYGRIVHLYGGHWRHWWQPSRWSVDWQSEGEMPKFRELFWPGADERFEPDVFGSVLFFGALFCSVALSAGVVFALVDGVVCLAWVGVPALGWLLTWLIGRQLWTVPRVR